MSSDNNSCFCSSNDEAAAATDPRPMVSVVVPAYNEASILAKNVDTLCHYLQGLEAEYRWEVLIVNDGSTDDTGAVAEACANRLQQVYVLHHPYNFRLGQALRFAFSHCRGDYVVVLDIDLSYSPDHIEKMLRKICETKAKIVIASPYMKGGKVSNVPWLRKVLSVWANRYLCMTVTRDKFSDKITTVTGMVRAYDREFLSRLNLKAMDVDINAEIIYKAMILRARIVEIPAHLDWGEKKIEKSAKGGARRSSLRILRSIVQSLISGFMFRPFMFFVFPGLLCILISLYPLIWTLVNSIGNYRKISGLDLSFDYRMSDAIGMAFKESPHAFVVGGFALIVGIQLFNLGLMALQNKRYFEELFHISTQIYQCEREKSQSKPREKIINT
jgi:glycosyltransferase involved in cell wall biosynthesis